MRPEASLTAKMCADLKAGGALSMALGIESCLSKALKADKKRDNHRHYDDGSKKSCISRNCC